MILKKDPVNGWYFSKNNKSAEQCLNRILQEQSFQKSELKLNQLLSKFPDFIDGWVHLAIVYENTNRDRESYLANREAYRLGLNCLPKQFDWSSDLLQWQFDGNRPFLRACFNLALQINKSEFNEEALQILKRLISVSPNDNLGARYKLLKIFFFKGTIRELEWLYKLYPEDYSPEFYFGQILLALFQSRLTDAKNAVHKACSEFPHVLEELKKINHLEPNELDETSVVMGGVEHAYVYWREFGALWERESDSYNFLIENYKNLESKKQ